MTEGSEPAVAPTLRFLLPSVRDLVFLLLFGAIFVGPLSNRPLADADIGWHIRSGELILHTHSVPRTDPFSASLPGSPWFAWEWLYDAVLGVLHKLGGLNAVVWLCALVVALSMTILLRALLDGGTGLPLAIVLMLLVLGAAAIHLFARPHIASWLFSLLWFTALDRWEQSGQAERLRWLFPLSMLLWVNVHGGWIFGLALVAIFASAASIEQLRARDAFATIRASQRARAMWWTFWQSALVTLLNPYGWKLHAHIYQYLGNRYLMNRINEFRSPDFHGWSERCFGVLVILLVTGLAIRGREVRISHVCTALLAMYAGFYSSRNLPVSAMLLALIVGPVLWDKLREVADRAGTWRAIRGALSKTVLFAESMAAQEMQLRGHLWPVAAVIAAGVICLQGGSLGGNQWVRAHFDPQKLPVTAVAFLDSESHERNSGPVLSTDAWSGYLIYHWYPARRVLIDDRHDFYGTDRVRGYLIMAQGEPGWQSVLAEWKVRTALLPAGAPLANLLRELPQEWRVTYEDPVAVILEKK